MIMTASPAFMSIRAYVMGVGAIYLYYVLKKHGVRLTDLGFTKLGFSMSLRELLIPSFLLIMIMYFLFNLIPPTILPSMVGYDPQVVGNIYVRILLYTIWSVPFQELLFRGYLFWKMNDLNMGQMKQFAIAFFVFVIVHIAFRSPLMMFISIYMGLLYVSNFLRYKNIYPIMISHAVVGSVLILMRDYYLPYN